MLPDSGPHRYIGPGSLGSTDTRRQVRKSMPMVRFNDGADVGAYHLEVPFGRENRTATVKVSKGAHAARVYAAGESRHGGILTQDNRFTQSDIGSE